MTDGTLGTPAGASSVHTDEQARARLARRYASERRFKYLGLGAVLLACFFLVLLLSTVVGKGLSAFTYHYVTLPLDLTGEDINTADPRKSDFGAIIRRAVDGALPFAEGRSQRRAARGLLSGSSDVLLSREAESDPGFVGERRDVALPVSDTVDLYLKGLVVSRSDVPATGELVPSGTTGDIELAGAFGPVLQREDGGEASRSLGSDGPSYLVHVDGGVVKLTEVSAGSASGTVLVPLRAAEPAAEGGWRIERIALPESSRKVSDREIAYIDYLEENGLVERRFNSLFFTSGASREPEMAGILGAVLGSFFTMLVTLMMSFPLGVAAAIYLEEFAPRNRWTHLIEVNINNLAAVPSIVFGLLGLAVFLNFFGLPRSAPLVGGMVLALMTLPTIIIASRAALKAVPPSIREAALGIGASKIQAVFHHVLPLAMPGIMTGTIIGMAQALGETAPLLMIGMVAFIVDIPTGFLDPATVLPVQIYMWADFPEQAFQQKTAAAILVLLAFLVAMNALAVLMRKRFERRW